LVLAADPARGNGFVVRLRPARSHWAGPGRPGRLARRW